MKHDVKLNYRDNNQLLRVGTAGIHEAERVLAFKELRKRGIEPKRAPPKDPEKRDAE